MELITIDIETKSDKDITKSGVYAYADSPYFDILLFSYSVDGGAVQVIDLANGEKIPDEILKAFTDETVIKRSHNVQFERVCLSVYVSGIIRSISRVMVLMKIQWEIISILLAGTAP